jgi:hypothetical protein
LGSRLLSRFSLGNVGHILAFDGLLLLLLSLTIFFPISIYCRSKSHTCALCRDGACWIWTCCVCQLKSTWADSKKWSLQGQQITAWSADLDSVTRVLATAEDVLNYLYCGGDGESEEERFSFLVWIPGTCNCVYIYEGSSSGSPADKVRTQPIMVTPSLSYMPSTAAATLILMRAS